MGVATPELADRVAVRPRPVAPPARPWVDRVLDSDPGLTQLRLAAQVVVTIGITMLAEAILVRLTHAMVPILAIMVGAVISMIASFAGPMFPQRRRRLVALLATPVPMIAGLAIGLSLAAHRPWALASLVVILAIGTYCRRFGPPGFFGGLLAFMGDFLGFFLGAGLRLGALGWLAAELAIGAGVAALAQFTLFFPSERAALRRILRSYAARSRTVARLSLAVFDQPTPAAARRLQRKLVGLNEAALMVDAHLADPGGVPAGWSPVLLHQCVFDIELALTNVARFACRLAEVPLPESTRRLIRAALVAVAQSHPARAQRAATRLRALTDGADAEVDQIVLHRFAGSVLGYAEAVQSWRAHAQGADPSADSLDAEFEPSAELVGGWLPGSGPVSATASEESHPGRHWWDRPSLTPHTRVAIQMAVAVTGALLLGDLLSSRRFYWAVIAAFVSFVGAPNAGEQLRKSVDRVAGTFVGIVLGALIAPLVGTNGALAITVILLSLFIGLALMRLSYAILIIGITVTVSMLYEQLDEFTDSLLVLRLEETALGGAVAIATVFCVLPLRTDKVARVAAREFIDAVRGLADQAVARLLDSTTNDLRLPARQVDAAYQALVATVVPPRLAIARPPASQRDQLVRTAQACRHYARNLLVDTAAPADLPAAARATLAAAGQRLASSLSEVLEVERHHDPHERTYTRSASLFDTVAASVDAPATAPLQLALRDLELIDGAMASLAGYLGLRVTALDA